MPSPFDSGAIGGLQLRNRFMRSATWDATATDAGEVTDASVALFKGLAQGGVGLISTGYAYVSDVGKATVGQYGVAEDRHLEGLRRLVEVAHGSGAHIMCQIVHAGSNRRLLGRGHLALAPSVLLDDPAWPQRAMTEDEIRETIREFAAAAARVRAAGFDAVQLHFAHGYLGSQFLSPLTNHRTDDWGGSPEKRRRFHIEVLQAVRKAVGDDFPVWAKFGIVEGEGGFPLSEGLDALKAMAAAGLQAVELSAGVNANATRTRRPDGGEELYFRDEAKAAKAAVDIPVALVGGFSRVETAEDIIAAGDADIISLARPLIREPGLIARWQGGDRSPAKCLRDNKCLGAAYVDRFLACQEEKRLREEAGQP